MISLDKLGEESLAAWKADVDLGDHVGVEGEVITSRRGELSILADCWAITSKCLRPLPDKHKGLSDPEARVRQRYVDLIVNGEAREMMRKRSAMIRAIRDTLHGDGYLEVETPMLQTIERRRQRAAVRDAHQRVRHASCYLRIATELLPQAADRGRRREGLRDQTATSATRARTPRTTRSSPCSSATRRTATTAPGRADPS